jgi:hypothetical protein
MLEVFEKLPFGRRTFPVKRVPPSKMRQTLRSGLH